MGACMPLLQSVQSLVHKKALNYTKTRQWLGPRPDDELGLIGA